MSLKPPGHLTAALLVRNGPAESDGATGPPVFSREVRTLRPRRHAAAPNDRVRVSLKLDPDCHHRFKDKAASEGWSLSTVLESALRGYIRREAERLCGGRCACLMATVDRT